MSFSEEYAKLRKKRLEEEEEKVDSKTSFAEEYAALRRQRLREEEKSSSSLSSDEIAKSILKKPSSLWDTLREDISAKKEKENALLEDQQQLFENTKAQLLSDMETYRNASDKQKESMRPYLKEKYGDILQYNGKVEDDTYFTSGLFADGYDFGDVSKTILGTGKDASNNFFAGALEIPENLMDAALIGVGHISELFGNKSYADVLYKASGKDIYDAKSMLEAPSIRDQLLKEVGAEPENYTDYSILGGKTNSLLQSGGQMAGAAALQAVGVPWQLTMGASSYSQEFNNAKASGATTAEAAFSAAVSAGAEILTERFFKIPGISVSGQGKLGSSIVDKLAKSFSSTAAKNLLNWGVNLVGEGAEETVTDFFQRLGQVLSYERESTLEELANSEDARNKYLSQVKEKLFGEEALESYKDSFIGGAAMSAVGGLPTTISATKNGVDLNSGLTKNEQAVVDKLFEKEVADREKTETISQKDKSKIYEEIVEKLEKGQLNTDDIESVLGGEAYKAYKDILDKETALEEEQKALQEEQKTLEEEYKPLNKKTLYELTGEESDRKQEIKDRQSAITVRLDDIKTQLSDPNTKGQRDALKAQLSKNVFDMTKNDRLVESYLENVRKTKKFEADLSKYSEKQKAFVQKAVDSGVLNNSSTTHELVDLMANIHEQKGVDFDFTNNEKLKESGFSLEGAEINGFVNGKNVTVNVNAKKALNSVVGHEVTHVLEGSQMYDALAEVVETYAKTKGEFDTRLAQIKKLYTGKEGYTGTDADAKFRKEVVADLVGDYIFTDKAFVQNLSTNRNVFQKIYDEIKYLYNVATAGSEQKRQLEKAKKIFAQVWRETKNTTAEGGTKYSIESLPDGRKYVKADRQVIFGNDPDTWSEQVESYINGKIRNGENITLVAEDGDELVLTADTAGKIASNKTNYGTTMDDAEFYVKANAGVHIDELAQVSINDNPNKQPKADKGGRHGAFAEGGWTYRTAYFHDFDGKYYRLKISAAKGADGNVVYNIGNIEERSFPKVIGSSTKDGGALNGKASFEANVPQETSGVNPQNAPTEQQNEKGLNREQELTFSLSNDTKYADAGIALNKNNGYVAEDVMEAQKLMRERVANRLREMSEKGVALPEDMEGKTDIANSSYDVTEENTTICPRSLSSEAFVDAVSEYIGRPLTVEEQIYISQDLQGRSMTPECTYCYVATDRKAYRAFLGEYVKQRDAVIEELKIAPNADTSRSGELYKEFLNGRKDTSPMYNRFKMWVDAYKNGTPMIDASHLANMSKLMGDLNEFGAELKPQIEDAMKYAQSASWAKKRVNYVAYNGHILKWKQDRINKLNSHYGLRMYSFSDFHPAFVLENMQMISDASVRGLKMLGYTKDIDFVEIFAPSGMNINVSTFGFESGGNVYENNIIGAEWEKAKALREQYPNVGITFVATNDATVNWALDQDWIDVVIPYHLVRTGAEVAKAFNYTNYTSESSDVKDAEWKKGDKKYIAPTEHNNDKATYLEALAKNHLKPRFERFIHNPNYMKLVNECRQSASESQPVQPKFNEEAIDRTLARLEANGYYQPIGGSVERMYEIAAEVAEDMTQKLAPTMSLSEAGTEDIAPIGWNVRGEDVAFDAPMATTSEAVEGSVSEDISGDEITPVAKKNGGEKIAEIKVNEEGKQKKPFKQKVSESWENIKDTVNTAVSTFGDKGWVFENLAKKTKNRELEAKYNFLHYSESRAQEYIHENLMPIVEKVKHTGKTKDVFDYVYHLHNIDRMSIDTEENIQKREDLRASFKGMSDKQIESVAHEWIRKDTPDEVKDRITKAREYMEATKTKNKPVFGDSVTADVSRQKVKQYEAKNPEFKKIGNAITEYNRQLRKMLVEGNVISKETADLWEKMYPHYVPIRREGKGGNAVSVPLDTNKTGVNAPIKGATGGNSNIEDLLETMVMRTEQTFKAIAKNNFGIELMNTLNSKAESQNASLDNILDSFDSHEDLLQEGKNGNNPTFTVFKNGKRVTFDITKEMYDAMKPTSEKLSKTYKLPNKLSNLHRSLLTDKNPVFLVTNAIKDAQDVLMNSQHAARTYANFPSAIKELASHGKWFKEYIANGGEQNTYFDRETKTFKGETKGVKKWLNKISEANDFVERIPRLAEYIASRKSGQSIETSMLDAARVTTNFSAGADVTKFLNRNGFTFLNASVQGVMQQVRNVREAKMNGLKGWAVLAGKVAGLGLSGIILNALLWDDDEEYEELSDYVKQNYYIVAKTEDGTFIRIPKGRTIAVIQDAFKQMENLITGDDEVDLKSFADLMVSNLAPNNPIENNILAPVMQAATNKTWYGEDLVPTRLQDVPSAEQYDESTDLFSKWLGEQTGFSPYKINYLLDQYTGGIGDVFLPMLTPEAESGDGTLGKLIAPWKDKFSTDSVMNNQNVSDFYDLMEELTVNANGSKATDEDILASKYMSTVNTKVSELYKQKREIQNSDLSDAEKYELVRSIQQQIVEIMKDGMDNYDDISFDGDNYAEVGEEAYRWYEPGEDSTAEPGWKKITGEQRAKQEEVTSGLGISSGEYWSNKEEYDYAYEHPGKYSVAVAVGGYEKYTGYKDSLNDIKSDKNANGDSISGSRKKKVVEYINSLDASFGEKIILFKSEYPSDDRYNRQIVEYLNSREDLSAEDIRMILTELDFTVDEEGYVTWD